MPSERHNITRSVKSVLVLIFFSFGSTILGFIREVLIASKYGSGVETDAFFIAISATYLFANFIKDAVRTTLIPVLSEAERKEGKGSKIKHTNNMLNLMILISIFLSMIIWIFAPFIVRILASGFKGQQFIDAVQMTKIGIPIIVIIGASGVFRGYLQSEQKFFESAISDFPYNFVYIIFLLMFTKYFNIKMLMFTSVLAALSQLMIQIPSVKKMGFYYTPILDYKDKYIKQAFCLVPPVLITVAINDINKIIDRTLASSLIEGSISALNYSNRIKMLIIGIFITAISNVLFPQFSNASQDKKEFAKLVERGIKVVLILTIPASIGIVMFSEQIIRIVFERGQFDEVATIMTAGALTYYSLGIVGLSLKTLLARAYYAIHDSKTPMLYGFISVILNVILNLLLINSMQHRGLALATSISINIVSVLIILDLGKKNNEISHLNWLKCLGKVFIASIIMAVLGKIFYLYVLLYFFTGTKVLDALGLIIAIFFSVVIYVIIGYILNIKELKWFIKISLKRIKLLK